MNDKEFYEEFGMTYEEADDFLAKLRAANNEQWHNEEDNAQQRKAQENTMAKMKRHQRFSRIKKIFKDILGITINDD